MTNDNGRTAQETLHDVIGVGFGPGGIALAAALEEEAPELDCLFLEGRSEAAWQPGMLLRGSDTQHHPSRDLATLRDPRSRYTFLNYLHETGRLLAFLNVPAHFPLRRDYARYVRWVAAQLSPYVVYDRRATTVSVATDPVPHHVVRTACGRTYRGRALVVGTGRTPYVPAVFQPHLGDRVCHSGEYLWRLEKRRAAKGGPLDVAVVGASQSAAEIALDLHSAAAGDRIHAVMRGFGYRLKDTSPFSEEAYFPEFTDYYFDASREAKAALDAQLRPSNYSSVDQDVLESLYVRRYEDGVDGEERLLLHRNHEVEDVETGDGPVRLHLRERHTGESRQVTVDLLVLATGYRDLGPAEHDEPYPRILGPVADGLALDDSGVLRVERDYFVPPRPGTGARPPLFLNGLCENTHGLGDAGSFSLLSLRARTLLEGIRHRLAAGPAVTGGTPA
ncbi:SidA/IucD/PvdA family monooxygenase [Streptomyces sp. NRRL S-31]|uniref:SidA/IucD/PvdA family monooxygenase n=1 Tax=Streptomyces sp. NRRL S-31 TaxID=1463898 RepID=UPI00069C51D0|nr:SidA/IucD/PvdA family monooxygenase [Streptomyces sp. NRRL S-31]